MKLIELNYFDSRFDKFYKDDEIITIDKDIDFRNVILFIKRL